VDAAEDVVSTLTSTPKWPPHNPRCAEDAAYNQRPLTSFPSPSAITTTPHSTPAKSTKNVYPTAANRDNILDTDSIYLYHPSPRQDMQNPLALTPMSPAHSPVLIENQYLTGVHSAKDPNVSTYTNYIYLPHDDSHKITIHTILTN
jgi:hypothetical protein